MRLTTVVHAFHPRMAVPLFCAVLLAGCSTSPTSGRTQFNILPGELETTVPDLRFGVKTMLASGGGYCGEGQEVCDARETAEKLAQRVAPIAERLGTKTVELSPEMVKRVPSVEVFVVPSDSPSVSSSASGKIAVNSGLARLDLSDTDMALALAREFGRLAAAHHRESTSAGLAVSLVAGSPLTSAYLATSILADIIFPMGALAKIGISLLASMGTEQLVEASQQDEADEFAGKLMLAAGYDLRELAEVRAGAPEGGIKLGWLPNYFTSRAKVAGMAPPPAATDRPIGDQALPQVAKAEDVAPADEMASKAVAGPELPEAKAEVKAATPAPETTDTAANDLKPEPEAKAVAVAQPVEMAATAAAKPEPAAMVLAEAVDPPLPSAETPEQQANPPKAKPAVAKIASKPTLKNRGKIRKPAKKKPSRR